MRIRARAWTALLLPPLAWFTFEQGLSAVLHADCTRSGIGALWGFGALLLCGAAFHLARSRGPGHDILADPWLMRLARAVAAIFALAIVYQTLAILLVPACVG